jgi:hypothetical protein
VVSARIYPENRVWIGAGVRTFLLLCALIAGLVVGLVAWHSHANLDSPAGNRERGISIEKLPVNFQTRTFDPSAPPAEMPPLKEGEEAVCDSDFVSTASVGGETRKSMGGQATLTVNHIKVTLKLNITIWTPIHATQHVQDLEEGHREISEYYYRTADQVARQIAEPYIGRIVELNGSELGAQSDRALEKIASEITTEYGKELNTEPTQLLYDSITDHARNDVSYKDAVAHALKNAAVEYR